MEARLRKLMESLPDGIDGALLLSAVNRQYYLGIVSSAGTLLVTRRKSYFIVDFRYIELARTKVRGAEVILQEDLEAQLGKLIEKEGLTTIGTDVSTLTLSTYRDYDRMTGGRLTADGRLEEVISCQRQVKSGEELSCMAEAARILDRVYARILPFVRAGVQSRELQRRLGILASEEGSERASFGFAVMAGDNWQEDDGYRDRVLPGRCLQTGDLVTLRMASRCQGYWADMSRTVQIGKASAEKKRLYEQAVKVQRILKHELRENACILTAVQKAAAETAGDGIWIPGDVINAKEPDFGHGIGLELQEKPELSVGCRKILKKGTALYVTVKTAIPGNCSVRIGDVVVVEENGARFLGTGSSPELIEV